MKNRFLVNIIKNYCNTNNLSLDLLSSNWILKLTNNSQIKYIYGYQFDLNSAGTLAICNDKSATSLILRNLNIPNVEHTLIRPPFNEITEKLVKKLFSEYKQVVCKVNNGTGGKDVYLVTSYEDLISKINFLFEKDCYVAICPYYEIKNEYRVIILNNDIKLIYSKERKKNWKHNLGLGAEPHITENLDIKNALSKLALSACNAVNGKFVSVDIIDTYEGCKVLEINSGIMMENFASKCEENYKIAEQIYSDAIRLMFN